MSQVPIEDFTQEVAEVVGDIMGLVDGEEVTLQGWFLLTLLETPSGYRIGLAGQSDQRSTAMLAGKLQQLHLSNYEA